MNLKIIIFTLASSASISVVVGVFGGMIFESIKVFTIGLGLMFLLFVLLFMVMIYDVLFSKF